MHLDQLAHRADAAVAEVVDVVRLTKAIAEPDHLPDYLDQVFSRQDPAIWTSPVALLTVQAFIQLIPTDPRQIVSSVIEEQVFQHRRRVVPRRRIAWPQSPVKLDQRLVFLTSRILFQGGAQE